MSRDSSSLVRNSRYFRILFLQNVRDQVVDARRLMAPIFFGLLTTIIWAFSIDTSSLENKLFSDICSGQLVIMIVFVMQMIFQQSMDSESQDGVFEQLRLLPCSGYLWFAAKTLSLSLCSAFLLIPIMVCWSVAHHIEFTMLFCLSNVFALGIGTLGLSALGVLLAAITMSSSGRSLIYAILFFVLSSPVVLSLVPIFSESLLIPSPQQVTVWENPWLGMLCAFSTIFMALGCVLFNELVETDL